MPAYELSLPGQKNGRWPGTLCDGDSDILIQKMLDDRLCGCIRITGEDDLGFAIFHDGEMREAYYLHRGQIMSVGLKALMDFRVFCAKHGEATIIRLSEMQLPYAKMQYLGRELLPVSDAALVNFSSLVRVHKEKLQNGLLIINSAEGDCGIIHIEDGQWKLKIRKETLQNLLARPGSRLCLLSYDEDSIASRLNGLAEKNEVAAVVQKNSPAKREVIMADTLQRFIQRYYGQAEEQLHAKVKQLEFTENNYPQRLIELADFIRFFVDEEAVDANIVALRKQLDELTGG
jgi:hypothetical protein